MAKIMPRLCIHKLGEEQNPDIGHVSMFSVLKKAQ